MGGFKSRGAVEGSQGYRGSRGLGGKARGLVSGFIRAHQITHSSCSATRAPVSVSMQLD